MSAKFNPSSVEKGECGCKHPFLENILHLENDLDFFKRIFGNANKIFLEKF